MDDNDDNLVNFAQQLAKNSMLGKIKNSLDHNQCNNNANYNLNRSTEENSVQSYPHVDKIRQQLKRQVDCIIDLDTSYLNTKKQHLLEEIDKLNDLQLNRFPELVHPTRNQLLEHYRIEYLSTQQSTSEQASVDDQVDTTLPVVQLMESTQSTICESELPTLPVVQLIESTQSTICESELPTFKVSENDNEINKKKKLHPLANYQFDKKTINDYINHLQLDNIDENGYMIYNKNYINDSDLSFYDEKKKKALCPMCPYVSLNPVTMPDHLKLHKLIIDENREVQCSHCSYTISKESKAYQSRLCRHLKFHFVVSLVTHHGLQYRYLPEEIKSKDWFKALKADPKLVLETSDEDENREDENQEDENRDDGESEDGSCIYPVRKSKRRKQQNYKEDSSDSTSTDGSYLESTDDSSDSAITKDESYLAITDDDFHPSSSDSSEQDVDTRNRGYYCKICNYCLVELSCLFVHYRVIHKVMVSSFEETYKLKQYSIEHFLADEFDLFACLDAFKELVKVLVGLKSNDKTDCMRVFGKTNEVKLDRIKAVMANERFDNTDILLMNWIRYCDESKIDKELQMEDGQLIQMRVFEGLNREQSKLLEHCVECAITLRVDAFELWSSSVDAVDYHGLNYEQIQKAGIYVLYLIMRKMSEYECISYVNNHIGVDQRKTSHLVELNDRAYQLSDFNVQLWT